MIYFIKSESGHVKIGFSENDVNGRLKSLQCGCPFRLSVMKIIDGDRTQEGLIQKKFKKARCQGEWFAITEELAFFIENPYEIVNTKKTKIPKTQIPNSVFVKYLEKINKRPTVWAKENGLPEPTIWRAYVGRGKISFETVKAIHKATNGAVKAEDWY